MVANESMVTMNTVTPLHQIKILFRGGGGAVRYEQIMKNRWSLISYLVDNMHMFT